MLLSCVFKPLTLAMGIGAQLDLQEMFEYIKITKRDSMVEKTLQRKLKIE